MTKAKKPKKVLCFIDGFNLYHGIESLKKPHLKWLDLEKFLRDHLAQEFSSVPHKLADIFYYTAAVEWRGPEVRNHQRAYVDALQGHAKGLLKTRRGKFRKKAWVCPRCKEKITRREEKETDVNIAIDMVSMAHQNRGDIFCLMSADTDLVPILAHLRQNFPHTGISLIFPPNRLHPPAAHFQKKLGVRPREMNARKLSQYLLPAKIPFRNRTITRPKAYAPLAD